MRLPQTVAVILAEQVVPAPDAAPAVVERSRAHATHRIVSHRVV